jgi:hypothetical protein
VPQLIAGGEEAVEDGRETPSAIIPVASTWRSVFFWPGQL